MRRPCFGRPGLLLCTVTPYQFVSNLIRKLLSLRIKYVSNLIRKLLPLRVKSLSNFTYYYSVSNPYQLDRFFFFRITLDTVLEGRAGRVLSLRIKFTWSDGLLTPIYYVFEEAPMRADPASDARIFLLLFSIS